MPSSASTSTQLKAEIALISTSPATHPPGIVAKTHCNHSNSDETNFDEFIFDETNFDEANFDETNFEETNFD